MPSLRTAARSRALAALSPAASGRRRVSALPSRRAAPCRCATDAVEAEVAALNASHGIAGVVSFGVGPGGLAKAILTHANKSSAEVHLFGATITSFCQPSGDEVLFVRPDAVLDGTKPISGGCPLCFPIFGPSPTMQQHGFARNQSWTVLRTSGDVNPGEQKKCSEILFSFDARSPRIHYPSADYPEPSVTLRLCETPYSLASTCCRFSPLSCGQQVTKF